MTTVIQTNVSDEMKRSYLDYAMSVIVSRALPDVRDGLKPVQRRIIYAMHKLGLDSGGHYSKCAKVVGEVLGKYHPHGDSSVYEALVRMAQTFSMRYTLIKGQGNFGSVDGDSAAAMRYTEAKLEKISDELLFDMHKNTVEFRDNFDGTLQEPDYLPSRIPNLLLNGAEGIAVGMATKIPPHNLGELAEALINMIDTRAFDKKLTIDEAAQTVGFGINVEDLLKIVKGPDFPTGGVIYSHEDIKQAYLTGRNSIIMRGVAEIEEMDNKGRQAIIITELPYQVNKATLVARIAELVQEKKLIGISDLRDESDRKGIRVVIELKRDAVARKILNNLFLKTSLQTTFPVNIVALVDGVPQTLSLKTILELFLRHRADVVIRRSRFDLKVAQDRAHILEGLLIAIDNIDEIVEIIKKSASEEVAKTKLIARFKFSEVQTQAILDMQLKKLTNLEKDKILDELAGLKALIAKLEKLLSSLTYILDDIKTELIQLKEKYGDKRKTKVVRSRPGEFTEEELIEEKEAYIVLTDNGYIKQLPPGSFKQQKRGGKGISAIKTNEGDIVKKIESCSTHDNLLFFTNQGRVLQIRAWDVPESSRQSKGKAVVNLINLQENEKVSTFFSYSPKNVDEIKNTVAVFFVTKDGTVKKTNLEEYTNIRTSGLIAIKLTEKDELIDVALIKKNDFIFLVSIGGKAITFNEHIVRPLGRSAQGVRGIKLKGEEVVTSMSVIPQAEIKSSRLLIVTEKGHGKLVDVDKFRAQNRGGVGIKAAKVTSKTGPIVFSQLVTPEDSELILTSAMGQTVKVPIQSIPSLSRNTQGVIVMRFSEKDDHITTAAVV
ncbi:MAG: DNA gyrase subunit A [Patescibacteria group bacterium]|jgi:DNA gyrase subunit A